MQKSGRLTGSETPLNDVGIVLGTTFSRLVAGQVTRLHRLLAAGFHRFLSPLYPPDALRTPLYPFVFVSLSARIHFTYISHPLREHFRERENLESRWNHKKTASIRSTSIGSRENGRTVTRRGRSACLNGSERCFVAYPDEVLLPADAKKLSQDTLLSAATCVLIPETKTPNGEFIYESIWKSPRRTICFALGIRTHRPICIRRGFVVQPSNYSKRLKNI